MTLEELRASLAAGSLRPAYLIAGEEPLQRDEALAALREHVLAGAPVDFNLDRLDGRVDLAGRADRRAADPARDGARAGWSSCASPRRRAPRDAGSARRSRR